MAKRAARRTRKTVIAGITAGVLSLGVAGTALATNATHQSPSGHTNVSTASARIDRSPVVKRSTVIKKVEHFYNSYIYAWKKGDIKKAGRVEKKNLTAHCDKVAKAWAKKHHADPILRSKSLPTTANHGAIGGMDWKGSKGSKAHLTVVLNYHGKGKDIPVTFDVKAGKISAIG